MGDLNILHFGAVRMRIVGFGTTLLSFYGFDKIDTKTISPIEFGTGNISLRNRTYTRLSNFVNEAGLLRIETTELGDYFRVNDITIYVKPIYTSYSSVHTNN